MLKQRGFSLLEVLLVLVCMAAIMAWVMHHYQLKQRRADTLKVESDIKSLQRALDTYFHVKGCDEKGVFNTTASLRVTCETLQQYGSNIICSRLPLVTQYVGQIIETDQLTKDSSPKPVYQLQIQATLATNLTADQITWYQQELQAKTDPSGHILVWNSLPANSYVQLGDGTWIMSGGGEFFRATENNHGIGGSPTPEYSGSFCAS